MDSEGKKVEGEESKVASNIIFFARTVSDSEMMCWADGHVCKDPLNTSSYTINWPEPSQLKVLLLCKPNDPQIDEWARKIIELLNTYKVKVIIEDSYHKVLNENYAQTSLRTRSINEIDAREVNVIVTIGGDGTILWANRYFKYGGIPPIIAFAMGTLNYMCNFPVETYAEVLMKGLDLESSQLLGTSLELEVKSRLECTVVADSKSRGFVKKIDLSDPKGKQIELRALQAINDISIERGQALSVMQLDCFINGEELTTVSADGIIIATPSGSTAYSMSAGGSLVHYTVPGILFTPVCPFSLYVRPLVFPEETEICLKVPADARVMPIVNIDGNMSFELSRDETLKITVSRFPVSYLVKTEGRALWTWCCKIKNLLNWNARSQISQND